RLLTNTVSSSMDEHMRFGGVVPEVASRAHVQAIGPAIAPACETAEVELSDIDAVAVTAGPGLSGALMVGVGAANGLADALDRPLYGGNHLAAHVAVDLRSAEHTSELQSRFDLVSRLLLETKHANTEP